MKYPELRDAAREHLAASTFRVRHTEGSAHGIYIGDREAIKGVVTFVDETGNADFRTSLDGDNGRMVVPLDHVIPAWLTDMLSAKRAKDVTEIMERLESSGIPETDKLTRGMWDIVNTLGRRGLAQTAMESGRRVWRFSPLGLYVKRECGVW